MTILTEHGLLYICEWIIILGFWIKVWNGKAPKHDPLNYHSAWKRDIMC